MYVVCMSIGWDPAKARANFAKHGVRFSDAETVLFDPRAITIEDLAAEGERRFVTLGADAAGRVLAVVWAEGSNDLRLISARRATRRERTVYEERV
jgi:uncharacterized DUF497 family protein